MPRRTRRGGGRRGLGLRRLGLLRRPPEHAVALGSALHDVRVMQQPIEERAGRRRVAQELAPLVDRPVRGEDRAAALVAAHDDLEQVLRGGLGQLPQAQVIDDEQRHALEAPQEVLALAVERRVGEFLEQDVRFAVEDLEAGEDHGAADSLHQVALARARRAEEERVLGLRQEAPGRQLEDQRAVELLVEVEVEAVERAILVAEAGGLRAPLDQSVGAPLELVTDQRREEVQRRQAAGLRLEDAHLQALRHPGQFQLLQGSRRLDQVHRGSFLWSVAARARGTA